ncbi:hypothetical protein GGQ85_003579 [Nitrobacter vulgaris]|nr:hypothetical protein [Nitrobacter vulgaris]
MPSKEATPVVIALNWRRILLNWTLIGYMGAFRGGGSIWKLAAETESFSNLKRLGYTHYVRTDISGVENEGFVYTNNCTEYLKRTGRIRTRGPFRCHRVSRISFLIERSCLLAEALRRVT